MRFTWGESEKEKFYQSAEAQLRKAEIDFIEVDRNQFCVRGWNEREKTVEAVLISLKLYPYKDYSKDQRQKLMNLENWECTDKYKKNDEKPMFMHSRLIITEI